MCVTCGCQGTDSTHDHHDHGHHYESIELEKAILATNEQYAQQNRAFLEVKKTVALNFVSSPGSGKTSLLEATIKRLAKDYPIAVVEGDQHTDLDADRIRQAGAQAHQINTGKACHLDAHMVGHAFEHLNIKSNGFMFIENVGNLICPSMFDLGEHHRVTLISTTEGDDKPLKYPDMFHGSDTVVINKVDLLPYVKFDIKQCIANIRKIQPDIRVFETSVTSGKGMDTWTAWLRSLIIR